MESKHTNRAIAFLCSNYSFCLDEMDSLIDLASNRCLMHRKSHLIFTPHGHQYSHLIAPLVPIALGKYLFTFRTQKSSSVAAIILQQREDSKVPNYIEQPPKRVAFCFFISKFILFMLK